MARNVSPQRNRGHSAKRCKNVFQPEDAISAHRRMLVSKLTQIFSHRYPIEERLVRHFERGKQRSWSLALPDNQLEPGGFTHVRRHVRLPRDLSRGAGK